MFKVVFFLWRRSDLTRQEFLRYYEDNHSQLGARILPRSVDMRRSYPIWDTSLGHPDGRPDGKTVFNLAPFDSMTELWYEDRSGFENVIAEVKKSPAWETMEADETKFMNRLQQVFYAIDERGLEASENEIPKNAASKLLRYARRIPNLSHEEFKQGYEQEVAPQRSASIPGIVAYRRNYPMLGDPFSFAGGTHNTYKLDEGQFTVDLIEEIWFADPQGAQRAIGILDADAALIDKKNTFRTVVEEYRSTFGRFLAPVASI